MANRHLARNVVLQSLFEWDFRGLPDKKISEIVERNAKEFGTSGDVAFMQELAKSVLAKREEIDNIIEKAAPDWPLDKISMTDRNILRIGLFELLFADRKDVPAKVAINEAIELAKGFGGENSGKFVNGVLGSVYKEIGEPGKDAVSKRRDDKFNLPLDRMPVEHKGGAVVYAKTPDGLRFAFVHDVFGHWTLSKGSVEEGETEEECTKREMKEELGLDVIVGPELARNEYIATHPEKGKIRKQVVYFLAEAKHLPLKRGDSAGLNDAKWFKEGELSELNFYEDIFPIIAKALKIINESK